jgi:hypothetical protein
MGVKSCSRYAGLLVLAAGAPVQVSDKSCPRYHFTPVHSEEMGDGIYRPEYCVTYVTERTPLGEARTTTVDFSPGSVAADRQPSFVRLRRDGRR